MTQFMQTMQNAGQQAAQQQRNSQPPPQARYQQSYGPGNQSNQMQPHPNASDDNNCRFCGLPGLYLRECLVAEEYVRTGRAMRNQRNDLKLPTGKYVPNIIAGPNLKARIDSWHHQNPLASQQQPQQPAQDPSPHMMFSPTIFRRNAL